MTTNKEFKTLESFSNSPFKIEGIEERMYTTKVDESMVEEPSTGKLFILKQIPQNKQRLHDGAVFTKVFQEGTKLLKHLLVPSSNMVMYICANLGINQTHISVNEDDFMDFCGYSKGSKRLYYQAISELVEKNIIQRRAGVSRSYWINPNILFNGDRTKL